MGGLRVEAESDKGVADDVHSTRLWSDLEGAEGDGNAQPSAVDADGDRVGVGVVVAEEELKASALLLVDSFKRGRIVELLFCGAVVGE